MTQQRFWIIPELPDEATPEDAKEYILNAVRIWRGQLFPGDEYEEAEPMWHLDPDTVAEFEKEEA